MVAQKACWSPSWTG